MGLWTRPWRCQVYRRGQGLSHELYRGRRLYSICSHSYCHMTSAIRIDDVTPPIKCGDKLFNRMRDKVQVRASYSTAHLSCVLSRRRCTNECAIGTRSIILCLFRTFHCVGVGNLKWAGNDGAFILLSNLRPKAISQILPKQNSDKSNFGAIELTYW